MIFGFLYVLVQQGFNGRKWMSRNVIYDKTEARTPKKFIKCTSPIGCDFRHNRIFRENGIDLRRRNGPSK